MGLYPGGLKGGFYGIISVKCILFEYLKGNRLHISVYVARLISILPLMYTAVSEDVTSLSIPSACQGSIEPFGNTI